MNSPQVCIPLFYFTLFMILLVLSILYSAYILIIHSQSQSQSNSQSSYPTFLPTIRPDQADDLAIGELPPRDRDYRKLGDPLKQPTRRYTNYPNGAIPGGNINIPTQGYLPSFQLMGYLKKSGDKPDPERMLKLFGRRIDTHKYEYYTSHHDDPGLKIPLERKGDRELFEGDNINVPGYPGSYQVVLYDLEAPKYIPYF